MEIVRSSRELTKREIADLATNGGLSVKDLDAGMIMHADAWAVYRDTDSKGEVKELLAILDESGEKPCWYITQSATFRATFDKLVEIMGELGFDMEKIDGTSKNGRAFVDCRLA